MTKFSANLGLLWSDLPLPDAIRAAKVAGFDAVVIVFSGFLVVPPFPHDLNRII